MGPHVLEAGRDGVQVIVEEVRVGVEGHRRGGVPEHPLDRLDVCAGPLLIPEQRVVLGSDLDAARAAARRSLGMYLGLPNYRRDLERSGFSERDLTPPGTDRLIDALAGYEADDSIRRRTAAHLVAGADQVLLQVVGPGAEDPGRAYPLLARVAGLTE